MFPILLNLYTLIPDHLVPSEVYPVLYTNQQLVSHSSDVTRENAQREALQKAQNSILQRCQHENKLQQQLCESTHLAMLEHGTWTIQQKEGEYQVQFNTSLPPETMETPDEMPLKEWARLLPVQ